MMSNVVKLLLLKQRQSLFALCSARKEPYKNGVGNFCSQGQDVHQGNGQSPVSFKDRLIQKHFHPKEHEVLVLKQKFPEPKQLFEDVYSPIIETDRSRSPSLYLDKALGHRIVKARLQLHWPYVLRVTGSHVNEDQAVENVYLLACELLQDMGLIQGTEDKYPVKPETVLKMLEKFAEDGVSGKSRDMFENVNTLETRKDENDVWLSTIQLYWPVSFTVTAEAREMSLAFHEACLQTAMQFKACGLLNSNNMPKEKVVIKIRAQQQDLDDFKPDAEIYTDASRQGFGAHFLSHDEDTVWWISESWPKNIYFDPKCSSGLIEFYALVTAVLTWKHKLKNKKLFCYSDNMYVANIINKGLYSVKKVQNGRDPDVKVAKLFFALCEACENNNITLQAKHILRVDNVAADLLSRNRVKSFQRIVPQANSVKKKTKKLEFCKPNDDLLDPDKDKKR